MLTEGNRTNTSRKGIKIITPHHGFPLDRQLIVITARQESLCYPTIETGKHQGNLMTHKSQLFGSTVATSGLLLTPLPYLYRRLNRLHRSAFLLHGTRYRCPFRYLPPQNYHSSVVVMTKGGNRAQ